jgi:beta-glucosidase
MTLEEKVGLMFHPNIAVPADGKVKYDLTDEERKAMEGVQEGAYAGPIGSGGQQPAAQPGFGAGMGQMMASATAKKYIEEKNFRNILNNGVAEPKLFAEWSNGMQEIAEGTRLGIPIMFSTDPRHGATLGAHVSGKQYFSQWPSREGQFGIAATRDDSMVKKFGEIVAEEYRAVGLHMILGPQIDVTTEPRWGRNAGCFSESAELTTEMIEAFMDGAQGNDIGPNKILVQLKHWPGSGPHKGGSGQWLVYPGNNFEYHLMPWKAGIAKGALAVMGYYSGTYFDTLGVNYSKYISTEVLYNQLGFKGSICTDWGVIGRTGPLRPDLVDMPVKDRFEMSINAGVDQFGSETTPELIVELVKEGKVTEERINQAASRILQWHFKLGIFEDPYVDPEAASKVVQSEKNQKAGFDAQLKSIVLLSNDGTLPAGKDGSKPNLYIEGIDAAIAGEYGNIVDKPAKSDMAIIRVSTAQARGFGGMGDPQAEVNIDLPKETLEAIKKVAASGVPTIAVLNLSGSLVVLPKELIDNTKATLMVFDVLDKPLMEVVFGKFNPVGKLPFDIPSSMESVRNQLEDVPFDAKDPIFKFGDGLSY